MAELNYNNGKSNSRKQNASLISQFSNQATDFTTKSFLSYLDEKFDPTTAKDEADLLKMERSLKKKKTLGAAIGSGAGTGASFGTIAGPIGVAVGTGIGALAGLTSGLLMNKAGKRKYERELKRRKNKIIGRRMDLFGAGQQYLSDRFSNYQNGGKVDKLSKKEIKELEKKTPAYKNKNLRPVAPNSVEKFYNSLISDEILSPETTFEQFNEIPLPDLKRKIDEKNLRNKSDQPVYDIDINPTQYTGTYYYDPIYNPQAKIKESKKVVNDVPTYAIQEYFKADEVLPKRIQNIVDDINTGNYIEGFHTQNKYRGEKVKRGKKEGGIITGEGGSKEDAVKADLKQGDFIIPADAPKDITGQLIDYLGINNIADLDTGNEDVNVSPGEVIIPKKMVSKANEFLVDNGYENGLNDLAPLAEDGSNYAEGGKVWDDMYKDYKVFIKDYRKEKPGASDAEIRVNYYNTLKNDKDKEVFAKNRKISDNDFKRYSNVKVSSIPAKVKPKSKKDISEETVNVPKTVAPSRIKALTSNVRDKAGNIIDKISSKKVDPLAIGSLAAAGQTIAGIRGLSKMGKRPERTISSNLSRMVVQTARDAQYGLPPSYVSKVRQGINETYGNIIDHLSSIAGASPGAAYNLAVNTLHQKALAETELENLNYKAKEQKKAVNRQILNEMAKREDIIEEGKIQRYDQKEQTYADVLKSGISNIIGISKYKKQTDFLNDLKSYSDAPYITQR